jgi:hypothetical protein
MSYLRENYTSFDFQPPVMFSFLGFHENGLVESCISFEDLSAYKLSWSHVDWCKFCIHLRCLIVRHFWMVEATVLQIMALIPA